jgi:mRNA interferase RelE/StbE
LAFEILILEPAIKELQKIDKTQASRILYAIFTKLTKNPQQFETLRHKFKGYRKLRVGEYRVIFAIEGNVVEVELIGHRREVYD